MTTLPFSSASFTLPIEEAVDESATAERAEALFNAIRRLNGWSVLRFTGVGPLLVALTWLNREYWSRWMERVTLEGQPTVGQWILMIFAGQFARHVTLLFGGLAKTSLDRTCARLPKDHAHAMAIESPKLRHLSLIGTPVTLMISGRPEVIEFSHLDGEVHVLWGDRSACLWIATSEDVELLAVTNVSTPATDVVRRKGCIVVIAGNRTCHVPDTSLANILEEMDLGKREVLSSNIESTSIATPAVQTVRFELLS